MSPGRSRTGGPSGASGGTRVADGRFRTTCKDHPSECLSRYQAFTENPATRAALKAGIGWTAAFDAGRLLGVDDAGNAAGRVDASLKWETPADDTKDSRVVASLTVTKKLGEVSVPFSIVYANKAKYLTGVDYGLSANVALKFNLFGS